jgi:hypothetical protein
MKKIRLLATSFCIIAVIAAFKVSAPADLVEGAWQIKNATVIHTLVCKDGYFSYVQFDESNKKFIQSFGGTYSIAEKQLNTVVEFDTKNSGLTGKSVTYPLTLSNNRLTCAVNNVAVAWTRLDDGKGGIGRKLAHYRAYAKRNAAANAKRRPKNPEISKWYPFSMDGH